MASKTQQTLFPEALEPPGLSPSERLTLYRDLGELSEDLDRVLLESQERRPATGAWVLTDVSETA